MRNRENRGLAKLVAIAVALATSCILILGTNFFSVQAEASSDSVETTASYTWFELINDDRELVIHLSDYLDGYDWKYGMDVDCLEELHDFEMTESETAGDVDADYSIHFLVSSEETLETKLTFVYLKDRESQAVETKILTVGINNNRIISVE